jgi:Flp pilus assembly protein TadD
VIESNDLQLMGDIGFSAVSMGNMLPARTIFTGILAVRPGHPAPLMGLAMSHYMVDEFEQAEDILLSLLKADPDYHLASVHLALCRILAGRREEALPLLQAAQKVDDPLFNDMVQELLEHPL